MLINVAGDLSWSCCGSIEITGADGPQREADSVNGTEGIKGLP